MNPFPPGEELPVAIGIVIGIVIGVGICIGIGISIRISISVSANISIRISNRIRISNARRLTALHGMLWHVMYIAATTGFTTRSQSGIWAGTLTVVGQQMNLQEA